MTGRRLGDRDLDRLLRAVLSEDLTPEAEKRLRRSLHEGWHGLGELCYGRRMSLMGAAMLGFGLGARHAFEADHIAAVCTLVTRDGQIVHPSLSQNSGQN